MKKQGIYILTNRVNGKQYVGQSLDIDQRVNKHFSGHASNCSAIHNAIKKYGKNTFDIEIIEYPLISKEALNAVEKWCITRFNTLSPAGYNLKTGGDSGGKNSEETKRKIGDRHRGRKLSNEHRLKISQTQVGKTISDQQRQKISKANRGRKRTPEQRRKISEATEKAMQRPDVRQKIEASQKPLSEDARRRIGNANRKKWEDPNFRKKQSENLRQIWKDPELREKQSKAHKGKKLSDEHRKNIGKASQKRWKNREYREKHRKTHREAMSRPEYKEKQRQNSLKMWEDPEYRRKRSEAMTTEVKAKISKSKRAYHQRKRNKTYWCYIISLSRYWYEIHDHVTKQREDFFDKAIPDTSQAEQLDLWQK